MTNYEKIMTFSPEDLAAMLCNIIQNRDQWWLDQLKESHIFDDLQFAECAEANFNEHLEWLNSEMEEPEYNKE